MVVCHVYGRGNGPLLLINAGQHTNEITSIQVAMNLCEKFEQISDRIYGSIVVYPILNIHFMEKNGVDYDNDDINRCYPGKADGSVYETIAYTMFNSIKERFYRHEQLFTEKSRCIVDIHCEDFAFPYIIKDRVINSSTVEKEISQFADYCGLTAVNDFPINEYKEYGLDRSLTGASVNILGIPALTIELGPSWYETRRYIEIGERAIISLARGMGMFGTDDNHKDIGWIKPYEHSARIVGSKLRRRYVLSNEAVKADEGMITLNKRLLGKKIEKDVNIGYVRPLHTPTIKHPVVTPCEGYLFSVSPEYHINGSGRIIATIAVIDE